MTDGKRKTAHDFPQPLLELYDGYVHGSLNKREFLSAAAKFAAAGVTVNALYDQLAPNYAWANQVAPDDPSIETGRLQYPSPNGHTTVSAYFARPPKAKGKRPAVLVVHENRGLNPYIEDVTRRFAKAGFIAMAPDGLSSVGGYPGNDDEGRTLQREVDGKKLLNDFFAAFEFLRNHADTTGKVGAIGFCYGGGVVNALAVSYPELAAGIPFYGRQPPTEDVAAIKAAMLIQYAELDDRINSGWSAYEGALKAAGVRYTMHMYPQVNHGFHNDTTPRYDEATAKLAEKRSVEFFERHLQ